MAKIIKYMMLFLFLVGLIFSCKPTAIKEQEKEQARVRRSLSPNPIGWDTLSVDTIQAFAIKGLETTMHLKINLVILQEYENSKILNKVNTEILSQLLGENYADTSRTVNSVLVKYLEDYLDDYGSKMKKYGEARYKARGYEKLSLSYTLSTDILYSEANLISYQIITTETTEKDSLGRIVVKNLLFDLTDGELLSEEDLFENNYSDILNQKLVNQILLNHPQDSVQSLQSQGYWGIADLDANNNFLVDRNSIIYTFNPGEYAEIEKGVLNIAIDFDSLQSILKKESSISILVSE